jgi:hypothetical protein
LGPAGFDKSGRPTQAPTGGVPQRNRIFDTLSATAPAQSEAAGQLAGGLETAAANPGWGNAADLANRTMRGDYLSGSPQLNDAMTAIRREQMASAADEGARIKSQYNQNGLGFSTGNQQALQNNAAAASARAGETEANTYLQNYEAERQRQAQAPDALKTALSAPLDYLSQVSQAYNQPLMQQAQLVQSLAGGGSTATPSTAVYREPGIGNQVLQGISGVLSAC